MVAHAHIMRVRAAPKGFFWGLSGSVGSFWGRFWSFWVVGSFENAYNNTRTKGTSTGALGAAAPGGLFFPSLGQCYFLRAAWAAPAA